MSANPRLNTLCDALRRVNAGEAELTGPLGGYSGHKIVAALSACLQSFHGDPDTCYLEVGVFQGLTLLSTAQKHPGVRCFGIDDFSLDPQGQNRSIIASRAAELSVSNYQLLDADYEDALMALASHLGGRKLGVYFVDGPHDYRSQLMCLLLALPHLHERAVIVIDDANYRHVRQASADFLSTFKDWKLLCQAYTRCHPANMAAAEERAARRGWWNGVHVLVRDPNGELPKLVLPTVRSRELYLYDHVLWSSRIAERLAVAVDLARALYNADAPRSVRRIYRLLRAGLRPPISRAQYDECNTYSEDLTAFEVASR